MSKRDQYGQYVKRRSPLLIVTTWLCSFVSVGLLFLAGLAVKSDLASFKSCKANDNGLVVVACGKQSLNWGDAFLIGMFVLAAVLVVTLFTAAWRMTRRSRL